MSRLHRTAIGLATAAALLALVTSCAAPAYTYVSDTTDQAYFKVPSDWPQISPASLAGAQEALLSQSAAGPPGGAIDWSRAYSAATAKGAADVFTSASEPMVYSSVQTLSGTLRGDLSFDEMRDLLFPVTQQAREEAAAAGATLTGFSADGSRVITSEDGVRGINELFEYDVGGLPDAFDLTVLTNSSTTKLYVLLVQCYQDCFTAHLTQIRQVVDSFAVRGS